MAALVRQNVPRCVRQLAVSSGTRVSSTAARRLYYEPRHPHRVAALMDDYSQVQLCDKTLEAARKEVISHRSALVYSRPKKQDPAPICHDVALWDSDYTQFEPTATDRRRAKMGLLRAIEDAELQHAHRLALLSHDDLSHSCAPCEDRTHMVERVRKAAGQLLTNQIKSYKLRSKVHDHKSLFSHQLGHQFC